MGNWWRSGNVNTMSWNSEGRGLTWRNSSHSTYFTVDAKSFYSAAPDSITSVALISWIRKWIHSGPSRKLHTDFDLLQVTMKLEDRYNIDLIPGHVKAHQNNDCVCKDLSWKAKLNCNCDHQAAMVWSCPRCIGSTAQAYQLPPGHCSASLQIGASVVTANLPMAICKAAYHEDMENYAIQKQGGIHMKFMTWWIGKLDVRQAKKHLEDHGKWWY